MGRWKMSVFREPSTRWLGRESVAAQVNLVYHVCRCPGLAAELGLSSRQAERVKASNSRRA
jgi:hypothetical protein